MKVDVEIITYITPDKGQSIIEVAGEIAEAKAAGKIGEKIFFNLPNGEQIALKGKTTTQIRDSIATQWAGDTRF